MISLARAILLGFCLLSTEAMADAPVVDDGENFALLEEARGPQAAEELPDSHESYTFRQEDAELPLAHDGEQSAKNTELLNTIQGLQQELQELRGQIESQAHELDDLKQQQLSFYQDLDARLNPTVEQGHQALPEKSKLNTAQDQNGPQDSFKAAENSGVRLNPADEQVSYLAAYELVKKGKATDAAIALYQFLKKYPNGGYSANAHYWLGELSLDKKDYSAAMSQFKTVLEQFQSSNKIPLSRLKLGYALAALGQLKEAKEQLLVLIKHYPDTPAAQLAQSKLASLGI